MKLKIKGYVHPGTFINGEYVVFKEAVEFYRSAYRFRQDFPAIKPKEITVEFELTEEDFKVEGE